MPNKNEGKGSSDDIAEALGKAERIDKQVEVVSERTPTDTLLANPSGSLTRERSAAPIRAENSDGDLAPIETTLGPTDGRLRPKNTTGNVSFSTSGTGTLATYAVSSDTSVSLSLAGDLGAPEVEGSTATYPVESGASPTPAQPQDPNPTESSTTPAPPVAQEAEPTTTPAPPTAQEAAPVAGTTVKVTPYDRGFSTRVLLDAEPAEAPVYRFHVATEGLTPVLQDQMLQLKNADGDVVARSRPLQMWDAQTDGAGDPTNVTKVDAELVETESGHDLLLRPSMEFLTASSTEYPVTVDPDISSVTREGDTWYFEGQSSSDTRADDYRLISGSFDGNRKMRALFTFSYKGLIGTNVTKATLKVKEYHNEAIACEVKPTLAQPMENEPVGLTYWDNQPKFDEHDLRFRTEQSFNYGFANPVDPGCAMDDANIDVTPAVNGWAGEHIGKNLERQGIILRAADELAVDQSKRFCSANFDPSVSFCGDASVVPVLSVTYRSDLGSQSWYSMTDHKLNDRSSLSVNNNNGNLVVGASDASAKGVGLNLGISRTYNSQGDDADAGALGIGWNLSVGPDVRLEKKSDYRYDYFGPGGTVLGSFVRKSSTKTADDGSYYKFGTPTGGAGADLEQDSGSGAFTLKFRGSQTKYVFGEADADGNVYLKLLKDRSDNKIEYKYCGFTTEGRPKLSSIVLGDPGDDEAERLARTYMVTYGGNYITKITNTANGVGLREWQYSYDGDYLVSYTDPSGNTTNYHYDTVTSGPKLLDIITDPANQSGDRPTTAVIYNYDEDTDVNQVSEVSYRYGNGDNEKYKYTWKYLDTKPEECKGNGNRWTEVTDPNTHKTRYCFKSRTDSGNTRAKTWVYDALGHGKSVEYTADNGPENVTDPSGQGISGGSTVAEYSSKLPDQLSKVTAPKSAADEQATTGFEYNAPPTVAGGDYLPTAVKSDTGNCNRFGYDPKGRTTDSYTGITASKDTASSCAEGGGNRFHRDYDQATGNVIKSWNANAGSDRPDDADSTIYTYWAADDDGYVKGTKHQLKSLRKPGGNCAATVAAGRKLCTSYTYDGAARVTSVTNGNAKVTTFTHDKMDRTTAAYFDGSTTCNGDSSNCNLYGYDAEGNLTSRTEAGFGQTSTFAYDRLNRQVTIENPTGPLQPRDQIGMAYDGTGNLTTYTLNVNNVSDEVSYAYDAANRLSKVTDDTGKILVEANADGRPKSIEFPKPSSANGLQVKYDYSKTGKPNLLVMENHAGTNKAEIDYSYVWDLSALYGKTWQVETSQMQKRVVTGNGSLPNLETNVAYRYTTNGELEHATVVPGADYDYEYDKVSNVTKETADSTTTYYGYDRAGELCWKGPNAGTQAQKLDRTCKPAPSGDTAVNQDAAGNITGTSSEPVVYNDRDQVATIGGTDMKYRDLGNDLRAKTGTTRTVSGPTGITATVDGSAVTFYTRDPQGTILNSHSTTGTANYVTEFNGSVAAIFSPSGTALGSYKYSPYGATTVSNGSGTTAATANRFRYVGGYQDKTSTGADGYYKLGARYYDGKGHFTQPDAIAGSIDDPKTMTAYNYAGGDPINSSDPSGYLSLGSIEGALSKLGKVSTGLEIGYGLYQAATGDMEGALKTGAQLAVGTVAGAGCSAILGGTGIGVPVCFAAGQVAGQGAKALIEGKV